MTAEQIFFTIGFLIVCDLFAYLYTRFIIIPSLDSILDILKHF